MQVHRESWRIASGEQTDSHSPAHNLTDSTDVVAAWKPNDLLIY